MNFNWFYFCEIKQKPTLIFDKQAWNNKKWEQDGGHALADTSWPGILICIKILICNERILNHYCNTQRVNTFTVSLFREYTEVKIFD